MNKPGSELGESPSAALARELRDAEPPLDDVTRARMERSLVQAWRMIVPVAARAPVAAPVLRRVSRAGFVAAVALSACIGGLIAWRLARESEPAWPVARGRFELRVEGAVVQSGPVDESQLLESGPSGQIALELRGARLDMRPNTRVRLERLSDRELAFSLVSGQLDVDFHPRRRGEQRLRVETATARVLVVGTRLRVEVDGFGATRVGVTQGAVDVLTRASAQTLRVRAGEHTVVPAGQAADHEPAMRAALDSEPADAHPPARSAEAQPRLDLAVREPNAPLEQAHLDEARRLLDQGRHERARSRLRQVSEARAPLPLRVEALTLMAESYAAQGSLHASSAHYRRADALAPQHAAGDNARFALARLLDRRMQLREAAVVAYRRYLELAPRGALALQAQQALCRLEAASCP